MKRILAAIVMMLVCFTACEAAGPKQHIILSEPFEVHKAGAKIATEVQIKKAHHYCFNLNFWHKRKEDAERVKKLVGSFGQYQDGSPVNPGIPIPLKITVSVIDSSGEYIVMEKEENTFSIQGGGGGRFVRTIGIILIPAGHCRITVETIKDIPELADVKVSLAILYDQRGKY